MFQMDSTSIMIIWRAQTEIKLDKFSFAQNFFEEIPIILYCQDIYETFNVFVRRKPKENNFKAVLETIRALMNTECLVPEWVHDIFLGYDDPAAAHYSK